MTTASAIVKTEKLTSLTKPTTLSLYRLASLSRIAKVTLSEGLGCSFALGVILTFHFLLAFDLSHILKTLVELFFGYFAASEIIKHFIYLALWFSFVR